MKVNITLLTMITWTGRRRRSARPGAELAGEEGEVDIKPAMIEGYIRRASR
jgi:hypothetical protein